MKTTLASVKEYAGKAGLEPMQVDGIPEGFAYQLPSMNISGVDHVGSYVAFIPLSEDKTVHSKTLEGLLVEYKKYA